MFQKDTFIQIDDVLVNTEIYRTNFACDLSACKGACCTLESEYGAPLELKEIEAIEKNLKNVVEYLPEHHRNKIAITGFYEFKDEVYMTRSVGNKACVFVYFDGDIAKCGIEKAWFEGKSDFRKPISCHLFPIRVSKLFGKTMRYEKFDECKPAVKNGVEHRVRLIDFLEDPLKREFGKEWYDTFREEGGE